MSVSEVHRGEVLMMLKDDLQAKQAIRLSRTRDVTDKHDLSVRWSVEFNPISSS